MTTDNSSSRFNFCNKNYTDSGLWHATCDRCWPGQLRFVGSWSFLLNNNSRELVPITDCSDSKWVAQRSRRCPYCPEFVTVSPYVTVPWWPNGRTHKMFQAAAFATITSFNYRSQAGFSICRGIANSRILPILPQRIPVFSQFRLSHCTIFIPAIPHFTNTRVRSQWCIYGFVTDVLPQP